MIWQITTDRPVYVQLVEHLELAVIAGEYPPGSKVPSVRDLAGQAAVNPNTMQKALQELEAKGLVNTQRTAGRTITEDKAMIEAMKQDLARERIVAFLESMKKLGFTQAEIVSLLQEAKEKTA